MTAPAFGSVAHALTILQAGCILYDTDERFPPRVFSTLRRRSQDRSDWGSVIAGVTYPDNINGVWWFTMNTPDPDCTVYGAQAREARAVLMMMDQPQEMAA